MIITRRDDSIGAAVSLSLTSPSFNARRSVSLELHRTKLVKDQISKGILPQNARRISSIFTGETMSDEEKQLEAFLVGLNELSRQTQTGISQDLTLYVRESPDDDGIEYRCDDDGKLVY